MKVQIDSSRHMIINFLIDAIMRSLCQTALNRMEGAALTQSKITVVKLLVLSSGDFVGYGYICLLQPVKE